MTLLVRQLLDFIAGLDIPVSLAPLEPEACFLPGIRIEHGGLVVDVDSLRYPGDLLHEAGHLAVVPSAERAAQDADSLALRPDRAAEEMMAMAWSYAAARHLGLDPAVVFHADGYKGGSDSLLQSFAASQPIGVPMLQYAGMCRMAGTPPDAEAPFPLLRRWLRE